MISPDIFESFTSFFMNFLLSLNFYTPNSQPVSQINYCGETPITTQCPNSPYRSFDGSCNNLGNPILGAAFTTYSRLLPSKYADGISTPPVAKNGQPLPSARLISLEIYPDVTVVDEEYTLAAMQYGQFIAHDMSLIDGTVQAKPISNSCCSESGRLQYDANNITKCYPILLPKDDPQRTDYRECMNLIRSTTDRGEGCSSKNKPADQINKVTHFLDLSLVYGNSEKMNRALRELSGGRLRVAIREGHEWPPNLQDLSTCEAEPNKVEPSVCYSTGGSQIILSSFVALNLIIIVGILSLVQPYQPYGSYGWKMESYIEYLSEDSRGDTRSNQVLQLAVIQVLWLREHNRLANALAQLYPRWNDEQLFQEARKITIAEHQFIVYYEWLPIHLGRTNALVKKLIYETNQQINDYRSDIIPNVINEHTSAAMRYFHSAIAGRLDKLSSIRLNQGSLRLSDYFNNVDVLEEDNTFDGLAVGLSTQSQYLVDSFHDSEITQYLFKNKLKYGKDLKAIDIQRSRDHGLGSYNDARVLCGHKRATTFLNFTDLIAPSFVKKLEILYDNVDDVELVVAGSIEKHIPGTLAGPIFLCIIAEQFTRTRMGDRFWFENGDQGTGFTLDQLNSIRNVSLSRLLCDNGNDIKYMQPNAFKLILIGNQLQKCETLPALNLNLWKDTTSPYKYQTLESPNDYDDLDFLRK